MSDLSQAWLSCFLFVTDLAVGMRHNSGHGDLWGNLLEVPGKEFLLSLRKWVSKV